MSGILIIFGALIALSIGFCVIETQYQRDMEKAAESMKEYFKGEAK